MTKIAWVIILLLGVACAIDYIVPPVSLPKALYADWAHKHWVWINAAHQNQSALLQLVKDYQARDIPVGAIDIDSAWSTGINNFVWRK
jgi:hypothetical protein